MKTHDDTRLHQVDYQVEHQGDINFFSTWVFLVFKQRVISVYTKGHLNVMSSFMSSFCNMHFMNEIMDLKMMSMMHVHIKDNA